MTFHPTEDKPIVFAGDKEGRMGVFDASQEVPEVDDEDEDADPPEPVISGYKIHGRTISSFQFSPADANSLYTASYDSSIRRLDIAKELSVDVYAPQDEDRGDVAISCLDVSAAEPNNVFFSTLSGELGRYDVRATPANAELWSLHDSKIGGFSLDPRNPYLLATASLDRSIKIWDLRKINGRGELRQPHLVGEHTSRLSVSHASWSSGGHVATTSYDDTIKIYDFSAAKAWKEGHDITDAGMEPAHQIRHNNQTGRWVTILKPHWQKHPKDGIQKLAIGNMNRFVDVYAANGEQLAQLEGDGITAVPAVAHFHPTMDWVAGGNASGKLALWM
jgi:WD repeat-containing protein 76